MSVQGSGNSVLTDDIIVKDALKLLKNELVWAPLVYRDLEQRFGKVGDVISLKLPYRTKSASGRTLVKQPLVDQKIPFNIDRQEHFGLEVTMRDRTLSIEQFRERYLKSGIVQIANKIDKSIADVAARSFFFGSGTPGTAITTKEFHYAKAHQGKVGVPDDGMRRCVLDMMDAAEISDGIASKFNEMMVKEALQKGYLGPLAGYSLFESANVSSHTVGAWAGSGAVNGADQTGSSLITDGWTNNITNLLVVGDTFTIDDVYEINPQSYSSTGRLQRFVVTAATDSDGSGNATISISPSINDGTLTTVDGEGNTISLAAYQNVSAAPANNAAITVVGTAGTTYRQNFLFHRDAIALAMIDLELPETAPMKARVRDDKSGLSMSMTGNYDVNNNSEVMRIDAVWGAKAIYPELGHRMFSDDIA
jgi:hypothetical protein